MIILGTIALFVFAFILDTKMYWDYILTTLVGVFGFAAIFCLFIFPYDEGKSVVENANTHEVVALSDNMGTHGSAGGGFLFFSGYQDSDLFYSWYERLPDGSYRSQTVRDNTENAIFIHEIEGDGEARVVEETVHTYRTSPGWAVPFGWDTASDESYTRWELYVPKGTIVRDTTLDAK